MDPQATSSLRAFADPLEEARRWRDELAGLAASQQQMERSGLLLALLLTATISLLLALPWVFRLPFGMVGAGPTLLGIGLGCALLGWKVWRETRAPTAAVWTLIGLISAGFVQGAWNNGPVVMVLLPATITLSHALLHHRQAAWVSLVQILSSALIVVGQHEMAVDLFARALATAVATLMFLQLMTRYWTAWGNRASTIGQDVQTAVQRLEDRRSASQAALEAAQLTDAASGLPNTEGFLSIGAERMNHHASQPFAVLALHTRGWSDACARWDSAVERKLTRALVERCRDVVGGDAVVGRAAPDDFLLLFPLDTRVDTDAALASLLEKAAAIGRPVSVEAATVLPHPCAGLSVSTRHGHDLRTLMRCAVAAREHASTHELSNLVLFQATMQHDDDDDAVLVADLLDALANDALELHLQPLLATGGGALMKAEALIRWRHPRRGWVPPGRFIPLVERSAVMVELTDWVLRRAAVEIGHCRATLHPQFQVSVNMPAAYLARCCEQPSVMLARLESLGLPPQAMVLEITESVMVKLTPEMRRVLNMLKALGFQLALDDFGVGHSSFGMLEKLNVDFLKLDKSFVDDIEHRPSRRAICEALITMAHHLGAQVVAEGVEHPRQRQWLATMGVDYIQGFVLGRPMPSPALQTWVAARAAASPG